MGLTIPVAHDFSCPWCYIGVFQARRLRRDFGAAIDWRGYELYPEGMDLPGEPPPRPKIADRPETPKRIELGLAAEGLEPIDLSLDSATRTHRAHEAVEFAKLTGVQNELVERIYTAYWRQNVDIDSEDALVELAAGLINDREGLRHAIRERRFQGAITPYNKPAYATGVFNVPTFWIGDRRFAEQPFWVLAAALHQADSETPYASLDFPPGPEGRPYVFVNMVSTIDGKTVSGSRDEGVMDLGSKTDHAAMRNIESAAEAVMIGAQTLRATPKVHFDPRLFRVVVSRTGDVDPTVRFFADRPDRAVLATPIGVKPPDKGVQHWQAGEDDLDFHALLGRMRTEWGVSRLLVEGGSELNASLLRHDLVDELFLTLAPKVRLGRSLPTYAGGEPLPKGAMLGFDLVSHLPSGHELFLRYRRSRRS